MVAEYVSRPAIAEALGVQRAATQKWALPGPDAVVVQANGREMLAWSRATVEAWAEREGRPAPQWS